MDNDVEEGLTSCDTEQEEINDHSEQFEFKEEVEEEGEGLYDEGQLGGDDHAEGQIEDDVEDRAASNKHSRETHRRGSGDHSSHHRHRHRSSGEEDSDSHRHSHRHSEESNHSSHRRHHRKHRNDHQERGQQASRSQDDSFSSQDMEAQLEDGELEDGEIDDEDIKSHSKSPQKDSPRRSEKRPSSDRKEHSPRKHREHGHNSHGSDDQKEHHEEKEGGKDRDRERDQYRPRYARTEEARKRRKERKENRDRDKRRRQEDVKEKKRKRHREYHDYDNVDENFDDGWNKMPNKNNKGSRNHLMAAEEEEYNDEMYDDVTEEQLYQKKESLMSMVEEDYLDVNVAVDEGENIYKRREGGKKAKKPFNKRKTEQSGEAPVKKKPLLMTPMNERPICRFYKEGKCSKGNDCPFNHEFKAVKKVDLCKYYLNGSCQKGDNCIFMHNEFPCKYFHTGQECYSGDSCKFSHDPLTDETMVVVERFYKDRSHGEEGESEHKPSLLGSPPRNPELERIKKIPSLFDIKVYPPGQSPQKGKDGPPPNTGSGQGNFPMPPQGMMAPPRGPGPPGPGPFPPTTQGPGPQGMGPPPPRPTGFYTDMNMPPHSMGGPPPPVSLGGPPPPVSIGPGGPVSINGLPAMAPINPAVELVGALLRQAAPQVLRPPMGPRGPPPGSMPPPMPFPGILGAGGPPPFRPGPFGPMVGGGLPNMPMPMGLGDVDMRPPPVKDESQMPSSDATSEGKTDSDEGNEKKLAELGLNLDSFAQIPPDSLELLKRIQSHQNKTKEEQTESDSSETNLSSANKITIKKERDDDNWYSSDEESGDAKLTDILKNLKPKEAADTGDQKSQSTTMNIMQMINSIKKNANSDAGSSPGPKQEPVFITSSEGDIPYRLRPIDVNPTREAPKNLDVQDPQFKNDPRIKKFITQLETLKLSSSKPSVGKPPEQSDSGVKVDPRTGLPVVKKTNSSDLVPGAEGSRQVDPRMQRSLSETGPRPMDPRMRGNPSGPGIAQHSLPVKPVIDPRLSGRAEVVARPSDPRFGRQQSLEVDVSASSPRISKNKPIKTEPIDPRRSGPPQVGLGTRKDPRMSQIPGGNSPSSNHVNNSPVDIPPNLLKLPPLTIKMESEPSSKTTFPFGLIPDPKNPLEPLGKLVPNFDSDSPGDHDMDTNVGIQIEKSLGILDDSLQDDKKTSSVDPRKPKLDYRNDPRFKRKPASNVNINRSTGQRKSSTDISSPQILDSEANTNPEGFTGFYRQQDDSSRMDPRSKPLHDPRLGHRTSSDQSESADVPAVPELSPFVPPSEPKIKTEYFSSFDPTASPFC